MLVTGKDPGNLAKVDAVLLLQDASRPHPGRHRVATVYADFFAFEILGASDAGFGVERDRAVTEGAYQEDGKRAKAFAVCAGNHVGGERHFAHVEFESSHHAAKRVDQRVDL